MPRFCADADASPPGPRLAKRGLGAPAPAGPEGAEAAGRTPTFSARAAQTALSRPAFAEFAVQVPDPSTLLADRA